MVSRTSSIASTIQERERGFVHTAASAVQRTESFSLLPCVALHHWNAEHAHRKIRQRCTRSLALTCVAELDSLVKILANQAFLHFSPNQLAFCHHDLPRAICFHRGHTLALRLWSTAAQARSGGLVDDYFGGYPHNQKKITTKPLFSRAVSRLPRPLRSLLSQLRQQVCRVLS